ncbi:SEC10/PgrA surface exclusion domain-containing protein [Limosilactobacillus reuteri]|uniref:SEC10/PgrA surface exclusion domain-containing protein n=1 Tax=Limosilactobacillus reuteri TaxID=1598 RepID=UPI001E5A45BA|nr:SEC10/PgrA surface exclusion domain-containing protein [Limosilactobacillus reuteri]MCC4359310.1 SEC10/PgrA surface exclusion domain-containing protein [Limosilactobacillus reuteri]MCC4363443.1 SEC10/PgrA surface exclusion domain-containing protein [Limosilactobacillus reuteri]MCC4365091.1 SEC10/PgrA surface exclusion domain-containing protein [Limosilactobacillus reuteri]
MMKEHNNMNAIKSHKKLYKSGKTWMAATLMTVGLAGGAMLAGTTTANADEVTPVQSAGTIQASQQATDPELANAQSDAQKQQSTIDSANAQLKDQQNQLSEAQGQQGSAQQELDQAKQAQQAATQNDPAVKQAQADVNQAQQQVDNQQQVVNDAQTAVNNDSQNIQSATSAVSQASQAVDQARQTATDAINQAAAQQANEAQNKIDQLENQGKAQASQNLNNQINNVSGQVTDAQNDVNNTNSKISDLQGQVKDLQDQEKNTQTDPNIKTVPNGVIDYSKSLLENVSRNNLWNSENMNADSNGNVVEQNIYVTPDNDKGNEDNMNTKHYTDASLSAYDNYYTSKFDGVNAQTGMNDSQKQELAILLMNQINHAREQRGLKPFTMTEQKYNQAQVRASQHSAQILSHDDNDIMTAFGRDQYECLAYIDTSNTTNMLDILSSANNTLSNMLNADASSDWGHRENFLEDTGDLSYDAAFGFHLTDDGQYYVLTFDYDGPARNNTPNMMDRIAQYQAMGPITGDAKTVDNSAKINDLNNQISNLQSTLSSQISKLQSLQSQLQNLQAQKSNIQFDLNQLSSDQQTEYNNAKETLATVNDWKQGQLSNLDSNSNVQEALNKLGSAKSNLASIKQTQSENEAKLQQAKDGLANLNQVLATKQAALDNAEQTANASANQAVKDAQAKLDTINGKISDLQNAIEATKSTISNAQAQLDKDNQKIADIKNNQKPAKPDTGKDEDNKGTTTPTDPSKDDNKGSETTNPTNPAKPDDGKKDDNKGTTTPSSPSKGGDQKDHQTTPDEPSKPSDGNKDNVTPTDPNKDSETTNPTTPTNPSTPAQPDTGNASISGQAGHKPATSDNGSEATDNTTTKPTIVLPTTDKESGSAVSDAQGQYINVVSKDSVASQGSQSGIQAPATPVTTNVSFGTKEGTMMTREEYKAQQAKLPQTSDSKNDKAVAVAGLGILAATTFTTMFGVAKKRHN